MPPVYCVGTSNLGDFLNGLPVLSGMQKKFGKFDLLIKKEMSKFKGIIEFLEYQDIFNKIEFHDPKEDGDKIALLFASWHPQYPIKNYRNNPNRPTETCG